MNGSKGASLGGATSAGMTPAGAILRRMRREDIPQVVEIDRLSFPMPWSTNVYHYELDHNPLSVMVSLALAGETPPAPQAASVACSSALAGCAVCWARTGLPARPR